MLLYIFFQLISDTTHRITDCICANNKLYLQRYKYSLNW